MNSAHVKELKDNDVLRKRLAKLMAKFCFRDTKLEELHDRISDEEMRALMIDCTNYCYALVCMLFATQGGNDLIDMLKEHDQVPHWDEPEMPATLIRAAKMQPRFVELLQRMAAASRIAR
jgi:hypothetical protein